MRRFNKQFKEEVVNLALARDIGIHENTLHKWINKYQQHQEHSFPGSGNLRPEDKYERPEAGIVTYGMGQRRAGDGRGRLRRSRTRV